MESMRNKSIEIEINTAGFATQHDYFENYNSLNGKGSGHHPFAGWTSLVVLIMAEKY
jgi:mannosyl-oligosaccharide glucosidase